jgi:dihydroxy-acid dehydratase
MLGKEAELEKRRAALPDRPFSPESQSPWQEIFREKTAQFAEGMVLKGAPEFQDIARTKGVPRDNH